MSRFVIIPEPVAILDPVEGTPVPDGVWPFAKAAKLVAAVAWQAGTVSDVFALGEARRKLSEGKVGDVVELHDDEYAAIAPTCRKPAGIPAAHAFSLQPHFRAIVDAPSIRPVHAAANGVAEEAPS